jgi:hypothetical protein
MAVEGGDVDLDDGGDLFRAAGYADSGSLLHRAQPRLPPWPT